MRRTIRRLPKEEIAERGDQIYDGKVAPGLTPEAHGKFVAIDVESGEFEIDPDEQAACARLRERLPDSQTWLRRVGYRYVRRLWAIRELFYGFM
jgi:hypothetical protein